MAQGVIMSRHLKSLWPEGYRTKVGSYIRKLVCLPIESTWVWCILISPASISPGLSATEPCTTVPPMRVNETRFARVFWKVWDGRYSEYGQRIGGRTGRRLWTSWTNSCAAIWRPCGSSKLHVCGSSLISSTRMMHHNSNLLTKQLPERECRVLKVIMYKPVWRPSRQTPN